MTAKTAFDFAFRSIDGGELPVSRYRGKALLVVNVASSCGLTPQYAGLEELWTERGDKGLVVLGVSSVGRRPRTDYSLACCPGAGALWATRRSATQGRSIQ